MARRVGAASISGSLRQRRRRSTFASRQKARSKQAHFGPLRTGSPWLEPCDLSWLGAKCATDLESGCRRTTLKSIAGTSANTSFNPEFGLGGSMLGHLTARVIDSWSNDLRDRGGVSVQTRKKICHPACRAPALRSKRLDCDKPCARRDGDHAEGTGVEADRATQQGGHPATVSDYRKRSGLLR